MAMELSSASSNINWSVSVKNTFVFVFCEDVDSESDRESSCDRSTVRRFSAPVPELDIKAKGESGWLSSSMGALGNESTDHSQEPVPLSSPDGFSRGSSRSPRSAQSWADQTEEMELEALPRGNRGTTSMRPPVSQGLIRGGVEAELAGGVQLSLGSVYHPHLCNQACKWMRSGHCEAGASCTFCHLDHKRSQRNSVVLDKQNRKLARKLTGAELGSLLSPLLTEKVAGLNLGPRASAALEGWSNAVAASTPSQGGVPGSAPSDLRRLSRCLRALPVSVLCRVYNSFSDSRNLSNHLTEVFATLQAIAAE